METSPSYFDKRRCEPDNGYEKGSSVKNSLSIVIPAYNEMWIHISSATLGLVDKHFRRRGIA